MNERANSQGDGDEADAGCDGLDLGPYQHWIDTRPINLNVADRRTVVAVVTNL